MGSLLASQIPCMFLLLIGTLIFGILPVYVNKTLFRCDCDSDVCKPSCKARKGKVITTFLIFFGGGVLLGTTFLHLLPESREAFEEEPEPVNCSIVGTNSTEEHDHEHGESFPIPEFIVCCGFFAVYIFEEIVHYFLGHHSHVPSEDKALRKFSRSISCSLPPQIEGIYTGSGKHAPPPVTQSTVTLVTEGGGHSHSHIPATFSLSGLLTVAALSFHSLFEGFAIGLQKTDYGTWIIFSAIAVHKFVLAFVVGLEVLATGGKNSHVYSYMAVFACMSPAGMAIAMITQSNVEETNPMVVSVLNAISTGTLLYVTFFEILQRDGKKDIVSWMQLVATAAGFGVMALMQYGSTFA